jgi:hypothetical protein
MSAMSRMYAHVQMIHFIHYGEMWELLMNYHLRPGVSMTIEEEAERRILMKELDEKMAQIENELEQAGFNFKKGMVG